jgi:Mrp family chromosome partitioning ATPase
MDEATQTLPLRAPQGASSGSGLDVILAGATPPANPGLLIESEMMEGVLEQAKLEYDLVIIDPPELNTVSDAYHLLQKVDGVIIVSHSESNSSGVADLKKTLIGAGAPLLGIVANGFTAARPSAYSQGYLSPSPAPPRLVPTAAAVGGRKPRQAPSAVEQS